jgi:hypothetical protein
MNRLFPAMLILMLFALPLQAEEAVEMQGLSIIGNQELPRMLYIVPWKASELPELSEPPLQSLIDEALAPIEREEFRRNVIYYDALAQQPGGSK